VYKVAAAMNPGTPSSQQATALMATEDDIPDYHQQVDQESHVTNEVKQTRSTIDVDKMEIARSEKEKEHVEPEQEYARTVNAMPHPTEDNKQHHSVDQANVKEEEGHSQKRKREGPQSKSSEELLKEEVTEIMDEFTTLGSYYQLVDKIGEGTG
jgi:hypothetical protein